MERRKILHTILMVEKDGEAEAIYRNVIDYQGLYGCLIELQLEGGETATFERDNWEMYDLTPTRGWNSNAAEINH